MRLSSTWLKSGWNKDEQKDKGSMFYAGAHGRVLSFSLFKCAKFTFGWWFDATCFLFFVTSCIVSIVAPERIGSYLTTIYDFLNWGMTKPIRTLPFFNREIK